MIYLYAATAALGLYLAAMLVTMAFYFGRRDVRHLGTESA
jgi:hypothetical protein